MIGIAKAILVGAAYAPRFQETKNGKSFLTFDLRVWRRVKGKEDRVSFFNIVAYGGAAEVLSRYVENGKCLYLDCTPDEYKDKEGNSKIQFVVNEFTFMGKE